MLWSKFVKFLKSILKQHVDSSPNFVSLCNFMKDNSSVLFSSSNIYFAQKEHIKMKTFETFKCLGQYLANSSCQIWNDKSIPLQTLRHFSLSWQITPLWLLSSYFFQLWIRGSHQNPNFETFKCSGENLPFSSCHFSSHKSVESNVR